MTGQLLEEFYATCAAPWGTTVRVLKSHYGLTLEIRTGNTTTSHELTNGATQALVEALTRASARLAKADKNYGRAEFSTIDGAKQPDPPEATEDSCDSD
jgi:hypothetical protein